MISAEHKSVGSTGRPLDGCPTDQATGGLCSPSKKYKVDLNSANETVMLNKLTTDWTLMGSHSQPSNDSLRLEVANQVLVQTLTSEWACADDIETAQIHVYLLDYVFPLVVLGLEKLLQHVESRSLVDTQKTNADCNPLNFLGQYLLRHNPRYGNFDEASLYARGLHEVSEQEKQEFLHASDDKVANMKAAARRRREDRVKAMLPSLLEMNRRQVTLDEQYYQWNNGNKVNLLLIQNALKVFTDLGTPLNVPVEFEQEDGNGVFSPDYSKYMLTFAGPPLDNLSFDKLTAHLAHCIQIHLRSVAEGRRLRLFSDLFRSCDIAKVGSLNRRLVLRILNLFYAKIHPDQREMFALPSKTVDGLKLSPCDHALFALVIDGSVISTIQFAQIMELFLHKNDNDSITKRLAAFLREGYLSESCGAQRIVKKVVDNEQDERLKKLRDLFQHWDSDSSGNISAHFLECQLSLFKTADFSNAINTAKHSLRYASEFASGRLSCSKFCGFMSEILKAVRADVVGDLLRFLHEAVVLTPEELDRVAMRKAWLSDITTASEICSFNMDPVYRSLFRAFYRDVVNFGGGKKLSVSIAILESQNDDSNQERKALRFVASSADQANLLLGKCLFEDTCKTAFSCVKSGTPIHVPSVADYGNLHFWDQSTNSEDKKGSFVIVPLQHTRMGTFGIIGIDYVVENKTFVEDETSAHSTSRKSVDFAHHQIDFYQAVATVFSAAYRVVRVRQWCLHSVKRGVSWLMARCDDVKQVDAYVPQKPAPVVSLSRILSATRSGENFELSLSPVVKLSRRENLFQEYLFKCAESSEPMAVEGFSQSHLVVPLRDDETSAVIVLDVHIGCITVLPPMQRNCFVETVKSLQGGVMTEFIMGTNKTNGVLFENLLLMKLRNRLNGYRSSAFNELKSRAFKNYAMRTVIKTAAVVLLEADATTNWRDCVRMLEEKKQTILIASADSEKEKSAVISFEAERDDDKAMADTDLSGAEKAETDEPIETSQTALKTGEFEGSRPVLEEAIKSYRTSFTSTL